jgi:hypothetical protein
MNEVKGEVLPTQQVEPTPKPWTLIQKISEKDDLLQNMDLKIGKTEIPYFENRISKDSSGKIKITQKRFTDKERDIGLKLLNIKTGEVTVLKIGIDINRDGVSVVASKGYEIEIVTRANGITWNLWNTEFKVASPSDTIVIKNAYPKEETISISENRKDKNGKIKKVTVKKKVIKNFLYVPYSIDLHKAELIDNGSIYIKNIVSEAFSRLRANGVKSKTFPDMLVADVPGLKQEFFTRLPLLEQGDLTEFTLDPKRTTERVLILIGSNGSNAFSATCNRVSACGWIQFTPKTYAMIRTSYKSAKLITDFTTGAADHVNSLMAAILLHDSNLAELVKKYGKDIQNDPLLEEYLAASYNGAPKWVHKSLNATLNTPVSDWGKYLRTETQGFMVKLRYLVNNRLP